MNLELALIAALAFFTGGTSLAEIAAVRSRTALSMLLILQRLGHAVPTPLSALLEAIQEAFVTFASQVISMVAPGDPRRRLPGFRLGRHRAVGGRGGAGGGLRRNLLGRGGAVLPRPLQEELAVEGPVRASGLLRQRRAGRDLRGSLHQAHLPGHVLHQPRHVRERRDQWTSHRGGFHHSRVRREVAEPQILPESRLRAGPQSPSAGRPGGERGRRSHAASPEDRGHRSCRGCRSVRPPGRLRHQLRAASLHGFRRRRLRTAVRPRPWLRPRPRPRLRPRRLRVVRRRLQ